jgi:hypothetical protein
MSLLENAPVQDLKRLLGAFPLTTLKDTWGHVKGTKEEICFAAAQERDVEKIGNFVLKNFGRCKLHVYVFEPHQDGTTISEAIDAAEKVLVDGNGRSLLLMEAVYSVFLKDPPEEQTVGFLWPIRVENVGRYSVLSFVVLERNPCSYFERDCYQLSKSVDERGITQAIERLGFMRADLHLGVKTLWDEDFMDSFRTKFKKPKSLATEHMDEELGIKKNNPVLYEELKSSVMFVTNFQIEPEAGSCVEDFAIDPSAGFISFTRYTEGAGDADEVVGKLLEKNG